MLQRLALALILTVAALASPGRPAQSARLYVAAPLPGAPTCPLFPASNVWNRDISKLPVARNSDSLIRAIGLDRGLHPDFGSYRGYGIPYGIVSKQTRKVRVTFDYADESDKGPYPIPPNPPIEGGSDRHILLVDRGACRLYELYDARLTAQGWHAGSGAIWKLRSNKLRPDGWTSADAAGLPVLPGLARYDEVARGVIAHALRFTAPRTRSAHIYPARHDAGNGNDSSLPPMGLRVRLKSSVDISGFGPQARILLQALKTFGIILADNGSPWFITGAPDARWNDDDLHQIGRITGADLEVVDTSHLRNGH
jgi:hypothetical protein